MGVRLSCGRLGALNWADDPLCGRPAHCCGGRSHMRMSGTSSGGRSLRGRPAFRWADDPLSGRPAFSGADDPLCGRPAFRWADDPLSGRPPLVGRTIPYVVARHFVGRTIPYVVARHFVISIILGKTCGAFLHEEGFNKALRQVTLLAGVQDPFSLGVDIEKDVFDGVLVDLNAAEENEPPVEAAAGGDN
ncbi:hypothetical protein LR48_Vigan785s001100 [Vigna angularis]|uniref:Uncharacterized protein n=1 Tax=Phaseolus angularis TaxID=3914 RepID=A0A0L9TGR4_PHAAN|nr:hypothetical protein LR48_Vigan785s001100 [Vigna angularis]